MLYFEIFATLRTGVPSRMSTAIVLVRPIIGLEVHVQLATRRKMFAAAPSGAHAHAYTQTNGSVNQTVDGSSNTSPTFPPNTLLNTLPNTLIDETVLALPGSLPVMNRQAVELSIIVGLLLRCQIAKLSKWDRKAYFYPDLPKAYQISQYDMPLCFDGAFDIPGLDASGNPDAKLATTRIGIIRAHLEEDAGKLLHEAPGGHPIDHSIVDYNRAGTPLLEIVTQPDFTNANDVVIFCRLLRAACRDAGATQGVLERGHIRFEPNINCELTFADASTIRTPIVEVKNLNSFRSLKGAIEFEIAEQPRRYLADRRVMGKGAKTTRGFDDAKGVTVVQRSKEDANDYRYFPDPDLPAVVVDADWLAQLTSRVPESPTSRFARLVNDFDLDPKEAIALIEDPATARLLDCATDAAVELGQDRAHAGRTCANLILQTLQKCANERGITSSELSVSAEAIAAVAHLRHTGAIGNQAVEPLLVPSAEIAAMLTNTGDSPTNALEVTSRVSPVVMLERMTAVAKAKGLLIVRDEGAITRWIEEAIAAQPEAAAHVRAGKQQAIGRLVGEVMKRSQGQADAATARERLLKALRV